MKLFLLGNYMAPRYNMGQVKENPISLAKNDVSASYKENHRVCSHIDEHCICVKAYPLSSNLGLGIFKCCKREQRGQLGLIYFLSNIEHRLLDSNLLYVQDRQKAFQKQPITHQYQQIISC